jgi:muramoyltetrapeptide carboxypeptidase
MLRMHLIAPAGSLQAFYRHLKVNDGAEMLSLFQEYLGPEVALSADRSILDALEDEHRGGRNDDDARARDISAALADDSIAGVLAVRGGAWFARILPKIDFGALDRRTVPVTVVGFSELTPFINIVAAHPMGRGIHDMGPAFLVYGLERHARLSLKLRDESSPAPDEWMRRNLREHVRGYLRQLRDQLRGEAVVRPIEALRVCGEVDGGTPAEFVGGNLTVCSTMIGSTFADAIDPQGRWLFLEDFNDKLERFDRFLACLTLAGF